MLKIDNYVSQYQIYVILTIIKQVLVYPAIKAILLLLQTVLLMLQLKPRQVSAVVIFRARNTLRTKSV